MAVTDIKQYLAGFVYCGKSTETILYDSALILVSNNMIDTVVGLQRSKIQGEPTISRPIVNEYGTIGEHLVFSYCLMKLDGRPFTTEEQVTVERWLTSPKYSSELRIMDRDYNIYSYYGLFTGTEWINGNEGFIMCMFTFQANGFYAYKHYTEKGTAEIYDGKKLQSVEDEFDFVINCQTDELEEYVYPEIKITGVPSVQGNSASFTLKNATDNNNTIEVEVTGNEEIYLDCQHCLVKRLQEGEYVDLKYKDIGWNNLGKIYWPRLLPGKNTLHITGKVRIEIDYTAPYKKVGGWLT